MTEATHPPPHRGHVDIEDDPNDPGRAREIDSRHDARSPLADPIIPTRPRAPLSPWLWLSALAALILVLGVAVLASRPGF